jgi:small subunit ribosomal protein S8
MSMSDPLADMLTRIRNAAKAHFISIEMPLAKLKVNVANVLKNEGYILNYYILENGAQGTLKIDLKYGSSNESVISGIKRVSKPGCRRYRPNKDISKVMNGLGIAILSTSQGVMTDKEARQQNVGGELLCEIW